MLRCHVNFQNLFGAKLKSSASYQQSRRWAAAIAAEKASYYDDVTLKSAKSYEDLPSMTMLPVIGTAWVFLPIIGRYERKEFIKSLLEKRKIFGDIYREKFGPLKLAVTFNADDLKTMYEHEGNYPHRIEMTSLKMYRESRKEWYSNMGLMLLNGEEWLDLRKKTQRHMMKPKAVLAYLDPMQDVARDMVNKILKERDENKEMPNLINDLRKWSLESVSLVGLDSRLGCLGLNLPADSDGMRMINYVQTILYCVDKLEVIVGNVPFWKYLPSPTWKTFTETFDAFNEICFKHINRSLEKLKSGDEDQDLTLLQSLLLKEGMDVPTAIVMVADMMMAGIDSTSHTMGFFLNNMAKNPDKQELLYQHIKQLLPNKEDRITPSTFNELRYLKACLKEAQRLDPIVGMQVRTLDHDVIFSGHRIPAGTVLFAGIQGIFRDEKYFSKPNEFLPERWLQKDEKFHPFAFLPFGFGIRSCLGRRLAEQELICLAVEIFRNFKVEYHHEEIGYYTRLMNIPDKPLRFNFIERSS